MKGPAAGPTAAALGCTNKTNRNTEPPHATPARMWRIRNTIMYELTANMATLPRDSGSILRRTRPKVKPTRRPVSRTMPVCLTASGSDSVAR